jgi:hypothetical protein
MSEKSRSYVTRKRALACAARRAIAPATGGVRGLVAFASRRRLFVVRLDAAGR